MPKSSNAAEKTNLIINNQRLARFYLQIKMGHFMTHRRISQKWRLENKLAERRAQVKC